METVDPPLAKRLESFELKQDQGHMQVDDLALCLMSCWDWLGFKMDALRQ
jgi:hypothetical protein